MLTADPMALQGRLGAIVAWGNCNTLDSSNQKHARVKKPILCTLNRVVCLSTEMEKSHFISAEVFNKKLILMYKISFAIVTQQSATKLQMTLPKSRTF